MDFCRFPLISKQGVRDFFRCGPLGLPLDVDSDKFRSFNHREELDSAVQFQIGLVARCSWCVLYIAQGYLYISTGLRQPRERVKFDHRYSSEKAIDTLLVRYSLDTRVRYSTYSPKLSQVSLGKAPRGPEFLHYYLIGYIIII